MVHGVLFIVLLLYIIIMYSIIVCLKNRTSETGWNNFIKIGRL